MQKEQNIKKKLSAKVWGMLPWLVVLVAIGVIIVLGKAISKKAEMITAAKDAATAQEEPAVNVVVQNLLPMTMTHKLSLPAVFKARKELTVKAEVGGLITKINVQEGDTVSKSQIIAMIDQRDYLNSIASIESKHKLAELNFNRISGLAGQAAVSKAELDRATAEFQGLDASLAQATLLLERCTITAPMDGIVDDLPIEVGTLVNSGDPIAMMLNIDSLELEVAVPEADVFALRSLKKAKVTIAALNDRKVWGEKILMAKKPVGPSMVFPLKLAVKNVGQEILPGMFATAELVKEVDSQALGIPLYAIITEKQEKYVYVIENNLAVKRMVTLGFLEDWKVQISSGLQPVEKVAIVGHRGLEEGQSVKVVKEVTDPGEMRQ